MHPIEHLRYVARARGADPAALAEEAAHALGSLHLDPSGLVVACRRIVERHPYAGALWWLCASVSTATEPFDAVWDLAHRIRTDPTAAALAGAIPDDATVATIGAPDVVADGLVKRGDVRVIALDAGNVASGFVRRLDRRDVDVVPVDAGVAGSVTRSVDLVLVEALAVDAGRAIVPLGSSTLAAAASAWGTPVWLVAGVGRRLPSPMIDAMIRRIDSAATECDPWELDVEVLPTTLVSHVIGPTGCSPMAPPAVAAECQMAPELLRHSAM